VPYLTGSLARTASALGARAARGPGRWLILPAALVAAAGAEPRQPPPRPDNSYNLAHTSQKLVDNRGRGFEPLYGTRNFRYVLRNVVFRGGANNALHRTKPRDNRNPLPVDGLRNLCTEGFGTAVYLYSRNFSSAPSQVKCQRNGPSDGSLSYRQLSPISRTEMRKILETVHAAILRPAEVGPVYLHCWNGWHASGLASALALRQFCGVDADAAVQYWERNTDGHNRENGYAGFREQIRDFTPYRDLDISAARRLEICPTRPQLLGEAR
jgi:hypothetical protein